MQDGSSGIGGHRMGMDGNGGGTGSQPPGHTWHDVMSITFKVCMQTLDHIGPIITRFSLRIAKSLDYHLLSLQLVFLPICHSAKRPSIPCMCTFLLSDQIEFKRYVATELIIVLQYTCLQAQYNRDMAFHQYLSTFPLSQHQLCRIALLDHCLMTDMPNYYYVKLIQEVL